MKFTMRICVVGTRGMGTLKLMGIVVLVGAMVIGGSVLIGRSDQGQINVGAVIGNSNQANPGGTQVAPVKEAFKDLPNGGLVPSNGSVTLPPTPEPQPEPTVTDEGTTTDEGTDAVTE